MPLPKKSFLGQRSTISMMELRSKPGEVVDCVSHGLTVDVEKNGKKVATLLPPDSDSVDTVILSDGTIQGAVPLTYRRDMGSAGY